MNARRSLTDLDRRSLLVERQLLGATGRSDRSLDDVVDRLGLLHATDPSTTYPSLHARCDATATDIDEQLDTLRSLVRHTTILPTLFVMTHDVARAAHSAVNPALVAKLRSQLVAWLSTAVDGDPAAFLASVEDGVVEHLLAAGPLTGQGLAEAVPELRVTVDPMPGASYSKPIRITSKVLEILAAERRIARARPSGADFTSSAWTWSAYEDWFGGPPEDIDADAALDGLLDRYLRSFAPATVTDMAWWTGVGKTKIRGSLARLAAVEIDLDGVTEPGHALADDGLVGAVGPVMMAGDPIVALLPGLDVTTMGWKQRDWYVEDDRGGELFDRNGNAGPTVWVDGRVVGAWTQRPDGEIVTVFTSEIGTEVGEVVATEAERLAAWLGDVRVHWRCPTPITKRLAA